jgi:hypothetical protein
MHAYKGHTDGLLCLAKGDSLLYSGGYDHTVKIWDAKVRDLLIIIMGVFLPAVFDLWLMFLLNELHCCACSKDKTKP